VKCQICTLSFDLGVCSTGTDNCIFTSVSIDIMPITLHLVFRMIKYHPDKLLILNQEMRFQTLLLDSQLANLPNCHAGDRGLIPYQEIIHYEKILSRVHAISGRTKCPVPPSRSSLTHPLGVSDRVGTKFKL